MYVFPLGRSQKYIVWLNIKYPVFLENGDTIIFTVVQQYINSSMDDLSVVCLYTAQPISQPPDVTNNAKSTRQADRVGHYAPAHISSVRMNNSGNISGLQDDGKCLLWKNQILFGIVKWFIFCVQEKLKKCASCFPEIRHQGKVSAKIQQLLNTLKVWKFGLE